MDLQYNRRDLDEANWIAGHVKGVKTIVYTRSYGPIPRRRAFFQLLQRTLAFDRCILEQTYIVKIT